MDSITKINKICKSVLALSKADFSAIDKMAQEQSTYIHPFKGETQAMFSELGNHNQRVLAALKNLHDVILKGGPNN